MELFSGFDLRWLGLFNLVVLVFVFPTFVLAVTRIAALKTLHRVVITTLSLCVLVAINCGILYIWHHYLRQNF